MIFWDTSAIVPLLVSEPESERTRALVSVDPHIVVWWGTVVECASALSRLQREDGAKRGHAAAARRVLGALAASWSEVQASEVVRDHACRLLIRHPLRAADALQLGAALTWAGGAPKGHAFATFDARLAAAATGEGFTLAWPLD